MDEADETSTLLGRPREPEVQTGLTLRRSMIIPCMTLYFFAIGIYTYVPPEYVQNYFKQKETKASGMGDDNKFVYNPCKVNESDPQYESYTHVQQEAARWTTYFSVASNLPAIISSLILTSYSDVIGRKYLFILCSSGFVVKIAIITIVVYFNASLLYIVLANVIDGCTGSILTMFAVLFSYVADITDVGASRTIYIVMFELLIGVTVTISSFATGYFIRYCGFFYPMLTCVLLSLITVVMVTVLIPETVTNRRRGTSGLCMANVAAAFNLYIKPGSKIKRLKYILLISSFTLLTIPSLNRGTLETLYQLGRPFCWSATTIGYFGAIRIGLASLLGIAGVFALRKCCEDDSVAAISAFLSIVSFIVEGLATSAKVLYTVPVIGAMTLVPVPMIRSLMSRITPPDKQGALFASIGAVETLCSLLGILTSNLVYSATVSIMNGFVFLLLALITAIGLIIMMVFICVQRRYKENDAIEEIVTETVET